MGWTLPLHLSIDRGIEELLEAIQIIKKAINCVFGESWKLSQQMDDMWKGKKNLSGGESNPAFARDRRVY